MKIKFDQGPEDEKQLKIWLHDILSKGKYYTLKNLQTLYSKYETNINDKLRIPEICRGAIVNNSMICFKFLIEKYDIAMKNINIKKKPKSSATLDLDYILVCIINSNNLKMFQYLIESKRITYTYIIQKIKMELPSNFREYVDQVFEFKTIAPYPEFEYFFDYSMIKDIMIEGDVDKIVYALHHDIIKMCHYQEYVWQYCSLATLQHILKIFYYSKIYVLEDEWGMLESIIAFDRIDLFKYVCNTYKITYQDIMNISIECISCDIMYSIGDFLNSKTFEYIQKMKNFQEPKIIQEDYPLMSPKQVMTETSSPEETPDNIARKQKLQDEIKLLEQQLESEKLKMNQI